MAHIKKVEEMTFGCYYPGSHIVHELHGYHIELEENRVWNVTFDIYRPPNTDNELNVEFYRPKGGRPDKFIYYNDKYDSRPWNIDFKKDKGTLLLN